MGSFRKGRRAERNTNKEEEMEVTGRKTKTSKENEIRERAVEGERHAKTRRNAKNNGSNIDGRKLYEGKEEYANGGKNITLQIISSNGHSLTQGGEYRRILSRRSL